MDKNDKEEEFKIQVTSLINKLSLKGYGDIPDYIIADYLWECYSNLTTTVKKRDLWYGFKPWAYTELLSKKYKDS